MTFAVYVSTAETVAPPVMIVHRNRLNRGVLEGCYIAGAHVTTEPILFINSTLFLNWIILFANSVLDSVAIPLVLVYGDCCSHYNNDTMKKILRLKSYWFWCQITPPILFSNCIYMF